MLVKTNRERIKEYLVGKKGYLKSDLSNGKVIMLSGKWGSGKTHFWQNEIIYLLNKEKSKIPNHYISLYGKTSIEEIKSEIFLKVFESMDIFKIDDKSVNLAKNTANLIADFTKTVSVFGVNLDLSKIVDKSFEKLDEVRGKQQEEKTEALLNSGAIICFDDFERKSKDIDLNDLFGFITQLTLNFKCKVVIILNDDVFEGEEKAIFTNVKEKTVSKFLKYEPSIEELFKSIFYSKDKNNKKRFRYLCLRKYKKIILRTIEETKELNARIYFQILDNLMEWMEDKQDINDYVLRCLILVNINFILNHYVFDLRKTVENNIEKYNPRNPSSSEKIKIKCFVKYPYNKDEDFQKIIDYCKNGQSKEQAISRFESIHKHNISLHTKNLIENDRLYMSAIFNERYKIYNNITNKTFQKINNFIETGILINE